MAARSHWRQRVRTAQAAFDRLEAFGDAHERSCEASGLLSVRVVCDRQGAAIVMRCSVCEASASESMPLEIVAAARSMGDPSWLAAAGVEVLPPLSRRPS